MAEDITCLVADDDEGLQWVLEKFLLDKKIRAFKAGNGHEALRILKSERPAIAIIDINMPEKDGLAVLNDMKAQGIDASAIVMTAESTMENALKAMRLGAFDYITKPFDLSELDLIVDRTLENLRLRGRVNDLSRRYIESLASEAVLVGKSKAMQSIFKTIGRIAPKDVTTLILGESGTGKELVARQLHLNSARSTGPFVAVNSAAVPRELMESELFGHEKGAFTGATESKKGRFELAHTGSLFLDEIGDMSPELQARLLRVLQEREFYRVGGRDIVKVDVRVIAATNQDLEKAVAENRFRGELLYRLNSVTLKLPPLRERKGDIELLSRHFLEKFHRDYNIELKILSEKALDALEAYKWPGNVRELENALRRAVLLSPSVMITAEDLNLPVERKKTESLEDIIMARLKSFIDRTGANGRQELYGFIMQFMERPLISLVLEKTKGNQVQASEVLGINRNTLRKKIKELNIDAEKFK
ncbi:MAG: sigma-54 dependent transcriptional regulator [Deltaproteobacteria bacterium]